MTREFDLKTPLFQLTVGELLRIIESHAKPEPEPATVAVDTTSGKYVHGLAGLMDLFGCSKTTASKIKRSGDIDEAITQIGNLIIVDAEKALSLAGKVNGKHKKHRQHANRKAAKSIGD